MRNTIKNKKKPKIYELTPLRTRIRMYARKIFLKSKKRISYAVLNYRIQEKFGVDLKRLEIRKKDIVRSAKKKKIVVSRKDERYEEK